MAPTMMAVATSTNPPLLGGAASHAAVQAEVTLKTKSFAHPCGYTANAAVAAARQ